MKGELTERRGDAGGGRSTTGGGASPAPHVLTLEELDRERWASCGPASLAALLGRSLAEIRHAFPDQRVGRAWTNRFHMQNALEGLGLRWKLTHWTDHPRADGWESQFQWPTRGLALIQFRGSWDAMPVNHPAQLQRSHWIAVKPHPRLPDVPLVFDINAIDGGPPMSLGWWQPRECWEKLLAPEIAKHFGRKATGARWVRAGLEVHAW